jgi:hypothetical protein
MFNPTKLLVKFCPRTNTRNSYFSMEVHSRTTEVISWVSNMAFRKYCLVTPLSAIDTHGFAYSRARNMAAELSIFIEGGVSCDDGCTSFISCLYYHVGDIV